MINKIRVGLASFGMSGKIFHAPLLAHRNDYILSHIIERSTDYAASIYPHVRIGRTFEELLNNSDIDLVIVNTPDHTHFEFARLALEHGKHVVVEKPFTQTVGQARILTKLAREKNKLLSVFHNRRWDGDFLTVQDIVRQKKLGRLVEFISHYDRYRPIVQHSSWKEQSMSGTGLLYNLGSHMIDQALVLFGMPDAVTAHLKIIRQQAEVDDWYEVRLHYPDLSVRLNGSYLVPEAGPRYVLHGTEGSFIKSGIDPQEDELKKGTIPGGPGWGLENEKWQGTLISEENGAQIRNKIPTAPGNYGAYYDSLWNSLTNGSEPPVTGLDGLRNLIIIEAAQRSSAERKTIDIPKIES
jgi:predicted dehydrogenase